MLIILTGKTASGKDTIKTALLQKYPFLKKVLTTTSRPPRQNEQDRVDYQFLTRAEFEGKIKKGEFAEYVEYGGNFYGTQKVELEKAFSSDTLWKIDPSRAGEAREFIKRSFPPNQAEELSKRLLVIYVNTPKDVVLQRLQNRKLPGEEVQKRIMDDERFFEKYKNSYDFVVENEQGRLDQTLDKVIQIIENLRR